jgi:ATP phosphoribosyltransferase
MTDATRLRIAVQKSGRLADPSLALLEKCGIRFEKSKSQLFCSSKNYPTDLLMLRDDDIPELVNESACDLGIVGSNVFEEKRLDHITRGRPFDLEKIVDLGFGFCRLSIAAPRGGVISTIKDLQGKKIATSYPETLLAWLDKNKINATTVSLSGAIEIAPRLEIADAICDLVSTGETLSANGLQELEVISRSQSILVRKGSKTSPAKEALIQRLLRRMAGVMKAEDSKYIMLHCSTDVLEKVKKALPGVESPTVLPLQGMPDKVAVHAVCQEAFFWETMEDLKAAGASAILVLPIEKMLD